MLKAQLSNIDKKPVVDKHKIGESERTNILDYTSSIVQN